MPTNFEKLSILQKENNECHACPLALEGRTSIVFGSGPPESTLFFVGEAPGVQEDKTGKPFSGKAGLFLRQRLQTILPANISFFLSNTVKCRPPKNRTPTKQEITCCTTKILEKEIIIVRPCIIITLGKTAFFALTKENKKVEDARIGDYFFQTIPIIATYHPAFFSRFPKWQVEFEKDLQRVLKTLSQKQEK